MAAGPILTTALEAERLGLSVIPPKEDGSKAPDAEEWGSRMATAATEAEVRAFYANGRTGLGIVCGKVSGGLQMFEFEGRAIDAGVAVAFIDAAEACGLGGLVSRIAEGYTEATPSGGLHWLFRTESPVSARLAWRLATDEELAEDPNKKGKLLIETKGEGGFTITAPSHGKVHPTGKPWTLITGGFSTIVTVTAEEQQALHDLARTFDEMPRPAVRPTEKRRPAESGNEVRPGDDYNARTTWAEVLEPEGWTALYTRGDTTYWRRPGKDGPGISATTGHAGADLLWVFSSSTVLEPERSYDRFGAFAALHYDGDLALAARLLAEQGYGVRNHHRDGDRRVQRPGDPGVPTGTPGPSAGAAWPVLDPAALHGPVGSFVLSCSPHTEADPAALLVTTLVIVGNNLNRGPHVLAGNGRHPCCLYVALVGRTAKGGKGTSWSVGRALAVQAFGADYVDGQVKGGFGSGEKLVDELAGTEDKPVSDSRMLVVEPEMARLLKVASRETSILSMTIRNGWDGYPLEARSRGTSSVAREHHLGVIAHITAEELNLRLGEADTYGGFANRFLWVAVQRARRLPKGGNVPDDLLAEHAKTIAAAVIKARTVGQVVRTPEAETRWAELYDEMGDDEASGLLAAVITRAEQQVLRLSLLYALLDGKRAIDLDHLEAAYALWRYCRQSAEVLFGDHSVNPDVDRLLAAIRKAGAAGLDLVAQMAVFGRNKKAKAMDAMRADLEGRALVVTRLDPEDTGGRRRTVTVAKEFALTNMHEVTKEGDPR